MTQKAQAILDKTAAWTEYGGKAQAAQARWQAGVQKAYQSKDKKEFLQHAQKGHAEWKKGLEEAGEKNPIMSKVMLQPVQTSLMEFGQKRLKGKIEKIDKGVISNRPRNPENAWNRVNAWGAGLNARRLAYASQQRGAENLKLLNPFAGYGAKGKEALKEVTKKK
jgi:hypothetical protein